MSLSCLLCPGSESDIEREPYRNPAGIDRSWSGGLTPQPYAHLRSREQTSSTSTATAPDVYDYYEKKTMTPKKNVRGHRKISSTGGSLLGGMEVRRAAEEPRLVRSGGMRRDWSFEDLRNDAAAMGEPMEVYA